MITCMPGTELWDVTDADGVPTGQTFRRGDEGWPEGRFHLAVAVCAVRPDGCFLLTRRSVTKDFPLMWEFASGSALAGESSPRAAARELREETGLAVAPEALVLVGRHVETSALVDLYVAPVPADAIVRTDPDEVHEAQWLHPDAVARRLREGRMASPWMARLLALWSPLLRAAGSITHGT